MLSADQSGGPTTHFRVEGGFFETGAEFVFVLIRQRDHATDHGQSDRARLFTGPLDNLDSTT